MVNIRNRIPGSICLAISLLSMLSSCSKNDYVETTSERTYYPDNLPFGFQQIVHFIQFFNHALVLWDIPVFDFSESDNTISTCQFFIRPISTSG